MSKKNIILLVLGLLILVFLVMTIFIPYLGEWIKYNWIDLFLAAILAFLAAVIMEYIYKKNAGKSNFSKTTMAQKPIRLLARLILPDQKEFTINQYERVFGREDFVGLLVIDDLLFIGKQQFKLTRLDDGFYIEDLNTKNGTTVNGQDITDLGKIKLQNNDEIIVAKILTIRYFEEETK